MVLESRSVYKQIIQESFIRAYTSWLFQQYLYKVPSVLLRRYWLQASMGISGHPPLLPLKASSTEIKKEQNCSFIKVFKFILNQIPCGWAKDLNLAHFVLEPTLLACLFCLCTHVSLFSPNFLFNLGLYALYAGCKAAPSKWDNHLVERKEGFCASSPKQFI